MLPSSRDNTEGSYSQPVDLTHSLTHSLTYLLTHSLTHLITQLLTYSLTQDNICHVVIAPAQCNDLVLKNAEVLARQIISTFSGNGIFGVELFLLGDDTILLNEVQCTHS